MVQVACWHVREVSVMDFDVLLAAWAWSLLASADDQSFENCDQLSVVVRLASQTVHKTTKVDFSRCKDRSLVIIKHFQELVEKRVVKKKGNVVLINELSYHFDVGVLLLYDVVLEDCLRIQQILRVFWLVHACVVVFSQIILLNFGRQTNIWSKDDNLACLHNVHPLVRPF